MDDEIRVDRVNIFGQSETIQNCEVRTMTEIFIREKLFHRQVEILTNCTVQVLRNSVTGDTSVGW